MFENKKVAIGNPELDTPQLSFFCCKMRNDKLNFTHTFYARTSDTHVRINY